MKKCNKFYLSGIGVFVLFVLWSILVLNGIFKTFDYQVFDFIRHYLMNDCLSVCFKIITFFGSATFLISSVFLILIFFKNKWVGVVLGFNSFLAALLNLILKNIFVVLRPDISALIEETGYSYPSGHAMASFAFYGLIIYLVCKKMRTCIWKKVLIIVLGLLIVLIGFSRIYLGVHHFSDIIGAYFISFSYLLFYIQFIKKMGVEKLL